MISEFYILHTIPTQPVRASSMSPAEESLKAHRRSSLIGPACWGGLINRESEPSQPSLQSARSSPPRTFELAAWVRCGIQPSGSSRPERLASFRARLGASNTLAQWLDALLDDTAGRDIAELMRLLIHAFVPLYTTLYLSTHDRGARARVRCIAPTHVYGRGERGVIVRSSRSMKYQY